MTLRKPMRQKVLLAIAFAAGALYASAPAMTEDETAKTGVQADCTGSVVQQIASNKLATPAIRAYYLLELAGGCLTNHSVDGGAQQKKQFETFAVPRSSDHFFELRNNGNMLSNFADALCEGIMLTITADSVSRKDAAYCDSTALEALSLLDGDTKSFDKLYINLIASRLFAKTGNVNEKRKCDAAIAEALREYENPLNHDEKQLQLASSILNSMAYGLVSVHVPDHDPNDSSWPQSKIDVNPYTKKNLKEAEKLKLRAIVLADRLGATSFVRKKAHRDLALWYIELGKMELAEQQKQILFELVGRKDESLMYPKVVACGRLDWFPVLPPEIQTMRVIGCGMG